MFEKFLNNKIFLQNDNNKKSCLLFFFLHISADLLMIFLPDESKRTIVPRQVEKICSGNSPCSLSEYCLRSLYENRSFYEMICVKLPDDGLPKNIYQNVMYGPICRCGYSECDKPLFTECHFSLMKK